MALGHAPLSTVPLATNASSGAASPDITLALSGSAATTSAGTLGVAFDLSASGQAATASAGTLSLAAAIALAGSSGTTSTGTLTPSLALALSGQAATGSAGSLTATIEEIVSQGGGGRRHKGTGSSAYRPTPEELTRLRRMMFKGVTAEQLREASVARAQLASAAKQLRVLVDEEGLDLLAAQIANEQLAKYNSIIMDDEEALVIILALAI